MTWEALHAKLRALRLNESPRKELFTQVRGRDPPWSGDPDALCVFAQMTGKFCARICARCTLARSLQLSSVVTGLPMV